MSVLPARVSDIPDGRRYVPVGGAGGSAPSVDRHAICTRRCRRRCGCGASCDARAGVMISGTASGRESRPSRSSRNPQAAAAPLPLLDASRLRRGVGLPSTRSSSPGVMGRASYLSVASGPSLVWPIVCRLMSLVQRKLSTLLPHGPDVIVCIVSGGQHGDGAKGTKHPFGVGLRNIGNHL